MTEGIDLARIRQIARAAAAGGMVLAAVLGFAPRADAGFIVTMEQVGSNVVLNGSGTIDLNGLSYVKDTADVGLIEPVPGIVFLGPTSATSDTYDTGFSGPTTFGSGSTTLASSGSGDIVGIFAPQVSPGGLLAVPLGYVSGDTLSDTSTYDSATFATLGVTPGTYEWTWGSGEDDFFELEIGTAAVPEPSSLLLLVLPLGLVMLLAARNSPRPMRA